MRTELVKLGFSRQSDRKADEGSKHPDRNAQFEYINAKVIAAQAQQQPVISVDTKKKGSIGNFKNGRTDYYPKGAPLQVNVHNFEDKKLGKVVPLRTERAQCVGEILGRAVIDDEHLDRPLCCRNSWPTTLEIASNDLRTVLNRDDDIDGWHRDDVYLTGLRPSGRYVRHRACRSRQRTAAPEKAAHRA
jgi:Rhodopirellula transposase DDE domain